jgi:hypothetical protein
VILLLGQVLFCLEEKEKETLCFFLKVYKDTATIDTSTDADMNIVYNPIFYSLRNLYWQFQECANESR